MENLIGSWKAKHDVRVFTNRSTFTLPEGSIVSVSQVDKAFKKVLIEFGPGDIDWKHRGVLNNFEQLN